MTDHFVDPPASTWKIGDEVLVGEDEGLTRCRVTDTTIKVDGQGEPYRSFALKEIRDESHDSPNNKGDNMTEAPLNLLNTTDAADQPEVNEGADSYIVESGTRFYGPFDSDDDGFAWATGRFETFNIRPVLAPEAE